MPLFPLHAAGPSGGGLRRSRNKDSSRHLTCFNNYYVHLRWLVALFGLLIMHNMHFLSSSICQMVSYNSESSDLEMIPYRIDNEENVPRVFVWPAGYPRATIGESRQILKDGIDRSTKLKQTFDIDEENVIYAVDFHRSNCDSIEALLQDTLERRGMIEGSSAGDTTLNIKKVVLFDFRDQSQKDSWKCLERLSTLIGKEGVEYACRQFWEGRDVSMSNKSIHEPFGYLGAPRDFSKWEGYGSEHSPHLLRYPVRSDMVEAMVEILQEVHYPSNDTDRITLPRPIDATSFSPIQSKSQVSVNLRGFVSDYLAEVGNANNLTIKVGNQGFVDETGRSTPQSPYMKAMLQSKIVVTAQRDRHEDHYRFFEAILSGALVMTDPWHPLPVGYAHGENVIVYTSLKDLSDQLLFYLSDSSKRLSIARAGYELAMESHRSWNVIERILLPDGLLHQ